MKALLLAATMFATPAQAVTLSIYFEDASFQLGPMLVAQSVDPTNGTLTLNDYHFGDWTVNATLWAAATNDVRGLVNAQLGNPFSGNAGSVYLAVSNITSPVGPATFIANTMTFQDVPVNWFYNATTYLNASYLNSPQVFDTPGTSTYLLNAFAETAAPYSVTQFYGFQSGGSAPLSPVPLPAALPMFLAGLIGIGALARRRRIFSRNRG